MPPQRPVKFPRLDGLRAQDYQSCTRPPRPKIKPSPDQKSLWSQRVDPEVLAFAEATQEGFAARVVPEDRREWVRKNLSLREFYGDWVRPDLEARVANGTLSPGTLEKDRQGLNRWEQYSPRPPAWPLGKPWPGLPIGFISPKVVEGFLVNLYAACPVGTARSTWCHVRNVLNHAVRVRAIETMPRPTVLPTAAEEPVLIYQPQQIEAAYYALKPWIDLQVAFVLAINAGPRTVDLFLLEWDRTTLDGAMGKPAIDYVARKTGKRQVIPLAPLTVEHLKRLPSRGRSPWLFPQRSNADMRNPEHSRPAMARRAVINAALQAAGLYFAKPIQAARATCNTRLNNWRTGVGDFVLGHALTLNSRHYFEPSDLICEGVTSIEQPLCFADF